MKKLLDVVSGKFVQIALTIQQLADLETMTAEKVIGRLKLMKKGCGQTKVDEKKQFY